MRTEGMMCTVRLWQSLGGMALWALLLGGCAHGPAVPDAAGLAARAQTAYQAGRTAEAIADYQILTQNLPTDPLPWFRLGNLYARSGQADAAVHAYREALLRDPRLAPAWHNLGIVRLRQAQAALLETQGLLPASDPLAQDSAALERALRRLPGVATPSSAGVQSAPKPVTQP